MGILSKIFGSEKIINGASKGLDKVFFTKEEKAELHIRLLKAYEPFKILQRYLALIVSVPFVITHLISIYFVFIDDIEKALKIAEFNTNGLGYAFGAVITLYLGGGLIEGAIGKFKNSG